MMGLLKSGRTRIHELEEANAGLKRAVENLTKDLADLQREVSSLSGRLRACENTGLAVNSRCERLETRLGKLEHQPRLPVADEDAFQILCPEGHVPCPGCDGRGGIGAGKRCDLDGVHTIGWRVCSTCAGKRFIRKLSVSDFFVPADDVEPPTKSKTCSTCRGTGQTLEQYGDETASLLVCSSCGGRGHVEVVP